MTTNEGTPLTPKSDPFSRLRLAYFHDVVTGQKNYAPECEAPPVDDSLLRRYLHDDASDAETTEVEDNLDRFRSWVSAIERLIGESEEPPSPRHE